MVIFFGVAVFCDGYTPNIFHDEVWPTLLNSVTKGPPSNRFLLVGQIDYAVTAFTEGGEQLVWPNLAAGTCSRSSKTRGGNGFVLTGLDIVLCSSLPIGVPPP